MTTAADRRFVRQRAGFRCEYCRMHEDDEPFFAFHLEHVIAKQHGGLDGPENRAWSCHRCNLHKGPNLSGIDVISERTVQLFHPRLQSWQRHYNWHGGKLIGRTQTGRATIAVLAALQPITRCETPVDFRCPMTESSRDISSPRVILP